MSDRLTDLLADYRDRGHTAFRVPDLSELESGPWRHRRRQRRSMITGMIAIAVLLVGLAVVIPRTDGATPAYPPAPVATSVYSVDWTNTELAVPHNPDIECPEGKLRLYPGYFPAGVGWLGISMPEPDRETPTLQTTGRVAYGDLTGDGRPEAVVAVRCSPVPGGYNDQWGRQLLVVTMRPDHSLVGLQFVGTVHATYPAFRVQGERLYVQMRYHRGGGIHYLDTAFTQELRWNGTSFDRVAGRTEPLNFTGLKAEYGVPSQLADVLSPTGEVLCPAALVRFGVEPLTVDGYTYQLMSEPSTGHPFDVDGDGDEELIVAIRCTGNGYDAVSVYVLAQGTDRFVAIDVPLANGGSITLAGFDMDAGRLILQLTDAAGTQTLVDQLAWTGDRFVSAWDSLPPGFGTRGSYRVVA